MQKAIRLNQICIDGGTQQRVKINPEIVSEYSESMKCGAKFPPVILFFDGAQYHLADGFHRYWASKEAEILDILADVRDGFSRDAILFSTGANGTHGMRLSNEDKRKAVGIMLADKEWSNWADDRIAKHCHVTRQFVHKLRSELTVIPHQKSVNSLQITPQSQASPQIENQEIEEKDEDFDPNEYALQEAHEAVRTLAEENQILKDAIAVGNLPVAEQSAGEIIAELRAQVKTLEASLSAVESSRNGLQRECAELKKQCAMQRKEIKKLKGE